MKIFLTGINGFVGRHLANRCIAQGDFVFGVDTQDVSPRIGGAKIRLIDLCDKQSLTALLEKVQPDILYHLAAISYVPDADSSPQHTFVVNVIGTISLLEAVRAASPKTKIMLAGSAKQYGLESSPVPITELQNTAPEGFYGISKQSVEMIGLQYVSQFGMDIRFTRSFNHSGPGQSPRFVLSEWSKKIAEISLGEATPEIQVGNLDERLDFTDVRDVIEAYRLIIEKGSMGQVYNVSSGKGIRIGDLLDYMIGYIKKPVTVHSTFANTKSRILIGDSTKLRDHTGWTQQIPMEKTVTDMIDWWKTTLASKNRA